MEKSKLTEEEWKTVEQFRREVYEGVRDFIGREDEKLLRRAYLECPGRYELIGITLRSEELHRRYASAPWMKQPSTVEEEIRMTKKNKLTESEWSMVASLKEDSFRGRVKCHQGENLALLEAAWKEDPDRFRAIEAAHKEAYSREVGGR